MLKRFEVLFNSGLDIWCNRTKHVIQTIGNVYWISKLLPILTVVFGDSDSLAFRKTIDVILFHVFFMNLLLFLK